MGWGDIWNKAKDIASGAEHKTGGTFEALGKTLLAPVGATWDITKLITPLDQDNGPDWLSAKSSLGSVADQLVGDNTLTGWAIDSTATGLNLAYKKGLEDPIEAVGYHNEGQSWGQAWDTARQRSFGQDVQLDLNEKINALSNHTGGWDTGKAVAGIPLVGSYLESAGIGAEDTKNIKAADADAWTEFQKHSPFWSGVTSSVIDIGAQFALDPGIAAGKASKPLRAANNLRQEGKGLDDLLGTVKFEDVTDARKTKTITDDFGNRVKVPNEPSVASDDFGAPIQKSVVAKPGRIDKMSGAQIYYALGLNKAPEQGQAIASLLAKTNDISDAAERLNARRGIVAAVRGDIGGISRLRQAGFEQDADTLSNAYMGRQTGSIAAALRDAGSADGATSAFNSPDVLAEIDRQLGNDQGYLEGLRNALEFNPLRTSSKGERAVARLNGQGLGRDGTLVTGSKTLDRAGNKALSLIARKRATGGLANDGSPLDDALANSTEFDRTPSGITGTPIDSDISIVHRGPFNTPVTVNRYGLKAAALNTFKSTYVKPGYVVSDALRGKVVHGALNIEQGNEPLVIEFVRDRLRRAGVDATTADKHVSNVIAATNPTDRFQSVLQAEHASISAIASKYGISDSAVKDLMVAKTRGEQEMSTAIDGQARYSAHEKTVLDDGTGDFVKARGDLITMTDEAGGIHINAVDDGAKPWPILSTQTPNKVMLPDIDFVRRILQRDAGKFRAIGKLRDRMDAGSPLVEEAQALGLNSAGPLRAQRQANQLVREFVENTNANWKRATLLLRPVSFMLRNTIEEEMRVWATGNLAATTHLAASQVAHRVSESRKSTALGARMLNPELHTARSIVATEREELLGYHQNPDTLSELKTVKSELRKARVAHARALTEGNYAAADDAAEDVAYFESRPELAQEQAGKESLADLDAKIAEYDKALQTKTGIAEGTREFRGIQIPNAYEGTEGAIHRQLTATGSVVDNETTGVASRSMSHFRGVGESPVLAAPPLDPPKGYERRHLTAWKHIVNNQIAQAPEARVALLAKAQGASREETVEEVQHFLDSPEAAKIRASNRMRARDTEAWAHDITDMVEHHVPGTGFAQAVLDGPIDHEFLAKQVPDVTMRPAVHGAGVDSVVGSQARKIETAAGYLFDKFDKMSLQTFTRHPYYNAIFQQEQERLIGHHLDDLIRREGDDAMVDPADINRISERARRTAERRIKTTFYDTSSRSYAAHHLRFIYPFFAAHQDAMQFWGKAIADSPEKLRQLQLAFDQPANVGLAVDHEGNPVKPGHVLGGGDVYYLMQMPKAWGGPDASDPKANQGRIKLRASSFNLILQNGSIINPGAGPIATVPAAYLQKRWGASNDDVAKALTIFNPYGAPLGDSISSTTFGLAAPTPVQRAWEFYQADTGKHSHAYNQMYAMYMNEAQVEFFKKNDAPPNSQQAKKLEAQVADRVKHASLLRFLGSPILPVQPTVQSKLSGMVSEYRRLQEQGRQTNQGPFWASDKFLNTYGDAYIALTKSSSEYRANVDPSSATWNELQSNKKLLRTLDPKTWQVVLAGVKDGPFSTDAYRAMQSFNVDNASNDKLIDSKDPKDRDLSIAVSAGWRGYSKAMDNLQAAATAYGYPSIDSSPELKAMRQGAVSELAKTFPDWYAEYISPPKDYEAKIIPSLEAIASDKKLLNDPARPEIGLVGQYLDARKAVQLALAARKAAGGAGTIDAAANADIASLFASYVAQLSESNTTFSSNIMPGLIEKDPLYKEELAVNSGGQ